MQNIIIGVLILHVLFVICTKINKMRRFIVVLLLSSLMMSSIAQEKSFQIYNGTGKKSSYKKMSQSLLAQDIVFFGELHDNPIAHWLELELLKTFLLSKEVTLGAEMLEANDQEFLEQFIQGEIDLPTFDSLAGLWSNFETDYLPVIMATMADSGKVVATNIPRKYASQVFKKGIESLEELPALEKSWIAPLPIEYDSTLTSYVEMLKMMPGGHGGQNFPKAQAIKDATMAYFISENMELSDNNLFYHLNGSYHSNNNEGIIWYLERYKPNLRIASICVVSQGDISKLVKSNYNLADFIIVVDEDMTSTY